VHPILLFGKKEEKQTINKGAEHGHSGTGF
jgi:hypothetical protein